MLVKICIFKVFNGKKLEKGEKSKKFAAIFIKKNGFCLLQDCEKQSDRITLDLSEGEHFGANLKTNFFC